MAAKYELNDTSVVVVVGSGAGGERSPTSFARKATRWFAWRRVST